MEGKNLAKNGLQKFSAQKEFAVDKVYEKLTQGIDDLPASEAVDGLLHGATMLKRKPMNGVHGQIKQVQLSQKQQRLATLQR